VSNTIGRVDFTATLDGRRTPQEAENIGRKAGAAAGDGYDKEWNKSFRDTLSKSGQRSYDTWTKNGRKDGTAYGTALSSRLESFLKKARSNFEGLRLDPGFLDVFVKKYDDAGLAAGELQKQLRTLRDENEITGTQFNAAKRQVDEWALSQRSAAIDTNNLADAIDEQSRRSHEAALDMKLDGIEREKTLQNERAERERLGAVAKQIEDAIHKGVRNSIIDMDNLNDSTKRVKKSADEAHDSFLGWGDMSHNARQWTLIIGAIAAGAEDIAALGSAAGGGLIALGGVLAGLIPGIAGAGSILVNLFQDLDKAPEQMRPVIGEFVDLRNAVGDFNDAVATAAFGEMEGSFSRLQGTLEDITPAMEDVGRELGSLIDDFTRAVAPGTEGFEEINRLIGNSVPLIDGVARSAGTLGLALIRAFNEANPLVQKTVDYIGTLVQRFDDFTRSNGFEQWMKNTDAVFSHLGPLLDATGRALNDLVTPESVQRTTDLLDDLGQFMPVLGDILEILGAANPFGLIAQALAEAGDALSPLLPALDDLATELSGVASDILPVVATALGAVVTAATPVVQALADIIGAIPPESLQLIAGGLIAVGSAIGGLKLIGLTSQLAGLAGAADIAGGAASKLGGSLKGALGKAGMAGIAITGIVAVSEAIHNAIRDMNDWEGKATEAVGANQGLAESSKTVYDEFSYMGKQFEGTKLTADNLGEALQRITEQNANGGEIWSGWTLGASDADDAAHDLRATLGELDGPLASLATENLPAASEQFSAWAKEAGASNDEILAMLDSMPKFKEQLQLQATAAGEVATNQNLIALALEGQTPKQEAARKASEDTTTALDSLKGKSEESKDAIDGLSDAITGFGETALDTRSAEREFESAVDDLTQAITDNGAALNDTRTEFDLNTEAGRDNQAAVDDLAQSTLDYAGALYDQTGDQNAARDAINKGRDALINQMKQLGFTQEAAEKYADELGLIPDNITTYINADDSQARRVVNGFYQDWNGKNLWVNVGARTPGGLQAYASGGTLYGPTTILAGEAGPEAIVPLNRPLSQVDESVRWLSAIAQGKTATPAMASGGTVGGGKQVTISERAIVIEEAGDPRRSAQEVLQRLAEQVAG